MDRTLKTPLVTTIKERCRVCYTCVRECPAKAIRISSGQAEVISERCIGCGNCVRVCSQHAKRVLSSIDEVNRLLDSGSAVAACVAPSFPAEFIDGDYQQFVGMVRAVGFDYVNEVAFGADLVADRYRRLMEKGDGRPYIATSCPAIIEFAVRYHPGLVGSLAPIVSPMLATARALRKCHGDNLKIVFIGPCIAKKAERDTSRKLHEIDAVLTFIELAQILRDRGITLESAQPSEFDQPHGGMGALFPVSRGILQAADITDNLISGNVAVANGKEHFVEAIKEFESGDLDVRLLEVLCCNGCIMGPGISSRLPLFRRRSRVIQYARQRLSSLDRERWHEHMSMFDALDLSRGFSPNDQRIPNPSEEEIKKTMNKMGKFSPEHELNCGACGYETCIEHAIAICEGLAESEMCLPHIINQLQETLKELAMSNEQLANMQEALMQSEKLASMGKLAAGIAHEVNNPLGVVLMYAHLLLDECKDDFGLREDAEIIVAQTQRCKKIVAELLNFARQNKVVSQPTDVCELVERSLKTLPAPEGVTILVKNELDNPIVELDSDQITQVLVNLVNNAYEAMIGGGALTVLISNDNTDVHLTIGDTGAGIPEDNMSRIFEPFFTTKQLGKGTGLGLAVAYGIVKLHRGDIRVESNSDPTDGPTGATFTVTLPRRGQEY